MDFLAGIENSGFATWVRESSSVWAYPTVLFLHSIGLGFLVGVNAAINLGILGFTPRLPLAPFEKFFPVMWFGFWVNAASGVVLLMIDATTFLANPVFYFKIVFIGLAIVVLRLLQKKVFRDPLLDKRPMPMNVKILAGVSLLLWTGAITAGRLTAYIGPVAALAGR